MRQITKENADTVTARKYYGFISPATQCRGFLAGSDFDSPVKTFRFLCMWEITRGNGFFMPRQTIQEAVADGLSCIRGCVLEFDSYEDLQKWLLT